MEEIAKIKRTNMEYLSGRKKPKKEVEEQHTI
jgi:hypothetical protein